MKADVSRPCSPTKTPGPAVESCKPEETVKQSGPPPEADKENKTPAAKDAEEDKKKPRKKHARSKRRSYNYNRNKNAHKDGGPRGESAASKAN